jgi:ABC-type antimicrobial peptide transport system permease subunit
VIDHGLRSKVQPRFYVAAAQGMNGVPATLYFELRTTGDATAMLNTARKTVLDLNEELRIIRAGPVTDLFNRQNSRPKMIARLCTIFGVIALLLAATGLYGVLSYNVNRRTGEIGIRMALGAAKGDVLRMILRETGLIVALGILVGIVAITASMRLVASRLYGLSAMDPTTIAIATAVLGSVALIAGYIPAARAARVNPSTALRNE